MTNLLKITEPGEVIMAMMAMGHDPRARRNTIGMDFVPTQRHDTYHFIRPEQHNLSGRSVFITGASRGLGAAYAVSYAKAGVTNIGLGARSNLDDTEQQVLKAAKDAGHPPPQILKIKVDITSNDSVLAAAKQVKSAFNGLDILINNAGAVDSGVPMTEVEIDDWWHTFQVNILGTFHVIRAFAPLLLSHPDPTALKTIITVGSAWGLTTFPESSAYQITKFAQLRFMELCNANFPPDTPASTPGGSDDGLLCYTVHPGGIKTELATSLNSKLHFGLMDTPELAADSLVWLTAERREWLRGRYISCMWDLEEFVAMREEVVRDDLLKVRMSIGGDVDVGERVKEQSKFYE